MKRKILTLILSICASGFIYAQNENDPSYFGPNDVIVSDFEATGVSAVVTDSLWLDTLSTKPVTVPSSFITTEDNPFPVENSSDIVAKYVRKAGGWRAIFIRLKDKVELTKTPYLQFQIMPVLNMAPKNTSVSINLINDTFGIRNLGTWKDKLPQDEWPKVKAFLGREQSNKMYNAIMIEINNGDSTANVDDTEYYIDQIGFKASADGAELPNTIFFETFGGWDTPWHDGKVYRQIGGSKGYVAQYDSIGGFSSGIHFQCKDVAADTASIIVVQKWGGISPSYEGASGGSQMNLTPNYNSTLESGPISVKDYTNLNFGFGFGTQQWWNNGNVVNARPKIEVSVDGGAFYELYTESEFLVGVPDTIKSSTGEDSVYVTNYQDRLYKWLDYPIVDEFGYELQPTVETVNLRMSYGAGPDSWVDDLWFTGKYTGTSIGVSNPKAEVFSVYPNPATNYILTPGAQKVSILDLNGRVVKEVINTEKVDVTSLAQGAYIVKVQIENITKIGKLIKK